MSQNFYTEELSKEIEELSAWMDRATCMCDGEVPVTKAQITEKLKVFAFNIRATSHKEIAQEILQIRSKWEGMKESYPKIVTDILIEAIEKRGNNLDVFKETLRELTK